MASVLDGVAKTSASDYRILHAKAADHYGLFWGRCVPSSESGLPVVTMEMCPPSPRFTGAAVLIAPDPNSWRVSAGDGHGDVHLINCDPAPEGGIENELLTIAVDALQKFLWREYRVPAMEG